MKPKARKVGRNGSGATASTQPQSRAHETVIIQITDEQGREWARVPFSRLEYSALKAVCDLRDCTMQELCRDAVTFALSKLGSPPPPAAQRVAQAAPCVPLEGNAALNAGEELQP